MKTFTYNKFYNTIFLHNETLIICVPSLILTDRDYADYTPTMRYHFEGDWDYIFKGINLERYVYGYDDEDNKDWEVVSRRRKIGRYRMDDTPIAAFALEDILQYNPEFDAHSCADVIIPNYQGVVYFQECQNLKTKYKNWEYRLIGEGNKPFYSRVIY
ncbi:MAG: hypothetical protein IJ667_01895 [Synergistaceae bacterium]|nr:hypothetical protein [Synergistaceae bacterium]